MPEDNPLVVGSPYPLLPIWSTVTLKFIEARDVPYRRPTIWVRFLPKA